MARFLLRRALILIAMLVAVSMVSFAIPHLEGGDPVRDLIRARTSDQNIDPAAVEGLRIQLGLDRPIPVQYLDWVVKLLHGDFGVSFESRNPVGQLVGNALLISGILAVSALVLALLVALPLGTASALLAGSWLDNAVTVLTPSPCRPAGVLAGAGRYPGVRPLARHTALRRVGRTALGGAARRHPFAAADVLSDPRHPGLDGRGARRAPTSWPRAAAVSG